MATSAIKPTIPWFGFSFAAACTTLIFFGFSFTLYPEVLSRLRPLVLYGHVATAAAWMMLVVVQAGLAMRRKLALHRRIGAWGFGLGAVAAVTAFASALVLRHEHILQAAIDRRAGRIAFLSIPLNSAIVFSVLLACAYAWRHRPATHRRCMLLAAAILTLPAVARIPGIDDAWRLVPTDALILLLVAIDLVRERRVHPAYWIGVPGIFAMQFFTLQLYLDRPEWWIRTASFLCGV